MGLLQLIEDDGLRQRMSRAALSASERFDPAQIAERHESLCAELVTRGARGRGHSALRSALHRTRGTVLDGAYALLYKAGDVHCKGKAASQPPAEGLRTGAVRKAWRPPPHVGALGTTAAPALKDPGSPGLSGADLAERLGVNQGTVRQDVTGCGSSATRRTPAPAPTAATSSGRAELPPLLLDDEEAVAVAVGLRTAAGHGIEGIGETSVRALAKLEQVLPNRLRRRVSALGAFTVPMLRGADPSTVDPALLTELAAACRDSERLRFSYRSHGGSDSRRTVEPHRLVCTEHRWYLVAWDLDRATGGPSGWTGSPRPRRTAPGSHPGPRRRRPGRLRLRGRRGLRLRGAGGATW
ncbi:hypothetical protein SMICM304S_06396 [Streptomyces microflavus]